MGCCFALDEVANIAPLAELPAIASEGGGQGLQLVAALQDLSQARARWGSLADGFLTLFGTKLLLPGVADQRTLEAISVRARGLRPPSPLDHPHPPTRLLGAAAQSNHLDPAPARPLPWRDSQRPCRPRTSFGRSRLGAAPPNASSPRRAMGQPYPAWSRAVNRGTRGDAAGTPGDVLGTRGDAAGGSTACAYSVTRLEQWGKGTLLGARGRRC